ncbi:hypothetical protein K4F52_005665 [Lecanicillium sp. MT-2017a]|nr:hypothetical protein K4F52_005665 [Lecanicillium sp. MT-2017a]
MIPNNDGFPMPNDQQKMDIAKKAGGLLPNGPLPKELGDGSATAFQLITANELFETAYFSSLLHNITDGVEGFEAENKDELVDIFTRILGQEEQHAIAGTATLKTAGRFAPGACEYMFPATDLKSSVMIAETFTALVLGALQGANVLFAKDNAPDLIQIVSSVIGQEGE